MIIEKEYDIKLSDIGRENKITNKALLSYLEDIGGIHSNIAGYGLLDIETTKCSWILLEWKVKIIRRPKYTEKLKIKTWSKGARKYYTYRDFEVYDNNNNLIAIAATKWVLMNIEKGKVIKVDDEILNKYEIEVGKAVIDVEMLDKVKEPEHYEYSVPYIVRRMDIDVNKHMHNLNYLDLANEVLPEEVFEKQELNDIRIIYKKEIKLGEKVTCNYAYEDNKHIITIKNEDNTIIHSIIEFE